MTLKEVIALGKCFARKLDADAGDYCTAEEFLEGCISLEDFNATDYEVEPEHSAVAVDYNVLVTAWNNAKGSSTAIDIAERSGFFKRFVSSVKNAGVTVVGG